MMRKLRKASGEEIRFSNFPASFQVFSPVLSFRSVVCFCFKIDGSKGGLIVSLSRKDLRTLFTDPSLPLFMLLVGAFFLTMFFRISATVVLPLEGARLGMSAALTGFISSLHFYTYAFMQPVSGILHDRYGPLRVVTWGLVVTAVSCLLLTFVRTPLSLGAWRLLSGLGVSPMYSATLVFQAFAFPPERYCFYAGINFALSNMGAIVSSAPLGFFLDTLGMPSTFALLAGVSLAMAWQIRRKAHADPMRTGSGPSRQPGKISSIFPEILRAIFFIFRNPRLLSMLILWAVSSASLLAFQGLWGASWFSEAFGASPSSGRFWSSLISVGMMFGPVLTAGMAITPAGLPGAIRRACTANALSWLILLGVVATRLSISAAGGAAFLVGITSGFRGVFAMAGVTSLAKKGQKGAVFGAMNMMVVLTAVIFQWGTGLIINWFPGPAAGTYDASGYMAAFLAVSAAMGVSLLSFRMLGRTPME